MEDVLGWESPFDYVGDEGVIVCANAGPDCVFGFSGLLVALAGGDKNHVVFAFSEFGSDAIAETERICEDNPGANPVGCGIYRGTFPGAAIERQPFVVVSVRSWGG